MRSRESSSCARVQAGTLVSTSSLTVMVRSDWSRPSKIRSLSPIISFILTPPT